MNKLREDLSIGLLGAASGLFSSSITVLIDRIDSHYAYLSSLSVERDRFYNVNELSWIPAVFWHVVLSILAACVVHRYFQNRLNSPFLLWQVVGITAMFGWALTSFLAFGVGCVMYGNLNYLEYAVTSEKLVEVAKYSSALFACNVVYGSVINAAAQQYDD